MQAKKVNIGEVACYFRRDVVLIYLLEDELEVGFGGRGSFLDEADEKINRVRVDPCTLVSLRC